MNRGALGLVRLAGGAGGLILPAAALACPFCDAGGRDSALFILAFFGFFALGMGAVVWAYARAGAFKSHLGLERRVLEAEGIDTEER
ncbi:MAG: hypothetical protein HYT87_07140 [Nitrospirae bacterium]|nr:hypothetical protein [Nitrospirota bacterium]